jgi:hypothetical protein
MANAPPAFYRRDVMVTPDTKDWTWVLDRPCPECGFEASELHREDIGTRLLRAAKDLCSTLEQPGAHDRPAPTVWSPLEYACHARDVCRVFDDRLVQMLVADGPALANWDQDAAAVAGGYAAQDAVSVSEELWDDAQPLAARYNGLEESQWDRTATRSDGAQFTVVSIGQYLVHDLAHHVWDVTGKPQGVIP